MPSRVVPNVSPSKNSGVLEIGKLRHKSRKHIPHALRSDDFVKRRNLRERKRVDTVNEAFSNLQNALPVAKREGKISKMNTLRHATLYIQYLSYVLGLEGDNVDDNVNSTTKSDDRTFEHSELWTTSNHMNILDLDVCPNVSKDLTTPNDGRYWQGDKMNNILLWLQDGLENGYQHHKCLD